MEGHEIERKTAWVPANNYCVHITAHNLKIVSAHFPGVRMLRKCFIPFVGTIYSKKHNGPKSRVRRRSFPGSKAQWHRGPFVINLSNIQKQGKTLEFNSICLLEASQGGKLNCSMAPSSNN